MALQDVHILIPRTCEYVTLVGKRDFANVTKVKDLEIGRVPWMMKVEPISLKVEEEVRDAEGGVTTEEVVREIQPFWL